MLLVVTPGAGMLNRILREKVREKYGKYRKRKCKRKRKYMGRKSRGMWESTLEKGLGAGILNRILGGKVQDKTGSTGN